MTKKLLSILALSICLQTAVFADYAQWKEWQGPENVGTDSFGYVSVGVGPVIFLPTVGLGYRQKAFNHGFDASINATTAIEAHLVQGNLLYHFYPNPFREDPWYFGAGAAVSFFVENHGGTAYGLAPDFVVGKRLRNKNFLELHVQAPTWLSDSAKLNSSIRLDFPLTYLKYGIAF